MAAASPTRARGRATGPSSHLANPAAHQGTWDLDDCQGLRTESRGTRPPDSPPTSCGRRGVLVPNPSPSGVSQLCEPHPARPDRHCERKTAGHEQTHYLFNHNLWAGVNPRGREKAPCPHPPDSQCLTPPPSLTRACSPALLVPSSLPPSAPFWFPCVPPSLCLSPASAWPSHSTLSGSPGSPRLS